MHLSTMLRKVKALAKNKGTGSYSLSRTYSSFEGPWKLIIFNRKGECQITYGRTFQAVYNKMVKKLG